MVKQPAKGSKESARPTTETAKVESASKATELVAAVEISMENVEPSKPEVAEPVPDEVPNPAEPIKNAEALQSEKPTESAVLEPKEQSLALPAVLGGLIASAIGFGAAYLVLPKGDASLSSQVSLHSIEISGLRDQIAAIPTVDLSVIEEAQSEAAKIATGLDSRIVGLETRLDDLLSRAGSGGSVATAAFAQELDTLKAEVEAMRGTAIAELDNARAQAASIQENADAAARAAAGRAALARVESGLETGAPLGAALDDLAAALQADVPQALTAVRDGAPTLASLQASFPDAARTALATSRREGASGEAQGGFAAFLRDQLDVRSIAPKEGNDADAVLSRAQAAIDVGRLTDTLAELGALPEVARAEFTEWQALAEARADAMAAAATLSTSLNDN